LVTLIIFLEKIALTQNNQFLAEKYALVVGSILGDINRGTSLTPIKRVEKKSRYGASK
jgi:hypothetical protein